MGVGADTHDFLKFVTKSISALFTDLAGLSSDLDLRACARYSSAKGVLLSACRMIAMICGLVYLTVFIRNIFFHLGEKILFEPRLTFGGINR